MAAAVRENLSEPAGAGGHDRPWLQNGALRESVGMQADGLQVAVGSNDPAAAPQEMGTSQMQARSFLAPVAAGMGEEAARGVAEAVVAAFRAEPEESAIVLAGTSESGRTHSVPYDPLGILQPGTSENENWIHGTIQRLQELGRVFHSERQDSEYEGGGEDVGASPVLPPNPDDTLQQGREEISHPDVAATGHQTFRNKQTGTVVRADKGEAGEPGYSGSDHHHIKNRICSTRGGGGLPA